MLHRLAVFVFFIAVFVSSAAAQNESRTALLIGFDAGTRNQQSNDVADLGRLLSALGFSVVAVTNASGKETSDEIAKFAQKYRSEGGIGLVFIAARFVHSDARSFIVPRLENGGRSGSVTDALIPLDSVFDAFRNVPGSKGIAIVDNLPFASSVTPSETRLLSSLKPGIGEWRLPLNMSAIGAADSDKTATLQCRRNGRIASAILKRAATGAFLDGKELFEVIAEQIAKGTGDRQRAVSVSERARSIKLIDDSHRPPLPEEKTLESLYRDFREAGKCRCGDREEQLEVGREILDLFGSGSDNLDVIEYVRKKVSDIELSDPLCELYDRFDASYKKGNWTEFFDVGEQIIGAEQNRAVLLDVQIARALVGHDRIVLKNECLRSVVTARDATRVIELIADGQKPRRTLWGIFKKITTEQETVAVMRLIRATAADACDGSMASALPDYQAFLAYQSADESTRVGVLVRLGEFYASSTDSKGEPDATETAIEYYKKALKLLIAKTPTAQSETMTNRLRQLWTLQRWKKRQTSDDADWFNFLETLKSTSTP